MQAREFSELLPWVSLNYKKGEREFSMSSIFNLDGPFFRFMSKVADVIMLGMIALVFCIPVITIVPTITAVYYITLKTVRDEEGYLWRSFWKSFKMNFKQGVIIELIFAIIALVLTVDIKYFYNTGIVQGNDIYRILFAVMLGVAFIAVITLLYVFPVLAKFENTIKGILRNSMFMAVRHLPATIGVVAITLIAGFAVYMIPPFMLFMIAIWAFVNSYIFVKILDNYIKNDDKDPDDFEITKSDETDSEELEEKKETPDIEDDSDDMNTDRNDDEKLGKSDDNTDVNEETHGEDLTDADSEKDSDKEDGIEVTGEVTQ